MTTASRGFVDILFILLCSTIVLLSESVRVGYVDTAPAEIGGGSISKINAEDVRSVIVTGDRLLLDKQPFMNVGELLNNFEADECALLISGEKDLSHQRMMEVWSAIQEQGIAVKVARR